MFLGKLQKNVYSMNCNQSYSSIFLWGWGGGGEDGLVEVTFGLVHVDYTLP